MNDHPCDCPDCRPPAYVPKPYEREDDVEEARRDKYAAELDEERRARHMANFAELDRADRTGPCH